ncbi:MAG: hypothetical protein JSW07_19375 [bacterium]|nr:MAG: hypothetical protein JSW07_19375 [bacterium]
MEDFSIKLHGNILLFILFFIVLIGLSLYVYRRTNPPVPDWLKRVLTILRIVSLVIMLFILFEPILSLSWNRTEKPIIAVLLDNSASMSLTDDGDIRSDKAKKVLNSDLIQKIAKDKEVEFYQFSDRLYPLSVMQFDSVKFNHDGTDITEALKTLKEKNIDRYFKGVILVTDGINNLGDNPVRYVEDFDTPLFPIAIGKAIEQKDVIIWKITSNQVTYANNKVPVDVTVQSFGYPGQKMEVQLLKDSELLDSKNIEVGKDINETKVRLHFTPNEPGFQKYHVQIPVLEDELTAMNNQKNFYTKVLKSKMKILFIAGSPDPDFKFIKKHLEADPNIEVDYWVVRKNQQFYQGNFPNDLNKLKQYDCIILQNFPGRNSSFYVMNTLKNVLESSQTPLLFVAGNGINYQALTQLKNFLPISAPFYESNEILVIPRLTAHGLIHPVTRIVDNEFENQQKWRDIPPIYLSMQRTQLYPGSETLIEVDPDQTLIRGLKHPIPIAITKKMGQHKSMAILVYGIWRWDLLMWGIGKSNDVFSKFLSNSVRWLITKEDSKLLRIYPDQEIYRNGQQVTFTGEVYYEDYRPMDGAEVKLKVRSKQKAYEILLNGVGEGKYEGALQALQGGDYSYVATATYNNREIGKDQGQFSVENFKLEFFQTKMNATLLQQLALKTNGRFFNDNTFSSLDTLLRFPPRRTLESIEMQLWNKLVLLIAAIILLSIEWFIRKRSGML